MDTLTDPPYSGRRMNPITTYFLTLRALFTRPRDFFRAMPLETSVVGALVFAIVTHWLGSALAYFWQSALGDWLQTPMADLMGSFDRFVEIDSTDRSAHYLELRQKFFDWMWGAASVLIDPFKSVVTILVTSFFVWLGAKLLVRPTVDEVERRLSYETAVKLIAFGMAPAILQGLPFAGPLVAWIGTFIVTWIGAQELYRVSKGRAAVIVLFPKILLAAFFTLIFLLLMFAFFQLFFSAMSAS